jgi:hypothetical protein
VIASMEVLLRPSEKAVPAVIVEVLTGTIVLL